MLPSISVYTSLKLVTEVLRTWDESMLPVVTKNVDVWKKKDHRRKVRCIVQKWLRSGRNNARRNLYKVKPKVYVNDSTISQDQHHNNVTEELAHNIEDEDEELAQSLNEFEASQDT